MGFRSNRLQSRHRRTGTASRTLRGVCFAVGLGAVLYAAFVFIMSRITANEILRPRRWRLDERWPGVPFACPTGAPSDFPASVCQTRDALLVVGPALTRTSTLSPPLIKTGDLIRSIAGIPATPLHARATAEVLRLTPAGTVVAITLDRVMDHTSRRIEVAVPLPEAVLDPADLGFPFEHVSLRLESGEEIRGWYIPPAVRPGRRAPALLYVHGRQRNRRHIGLTDLARPAHDRGYGLLLVDLLGSGASDGAVDFWDHEEISLAIGFLSSRHEIDPDRIGVVGISFGGMKALTAASDPRLPIGALAIVAAADTSPSYIRLIVPPEALPTFIRRRLMHGMTLPSWLVESGRPLVNWWFRRATGRCLSEVAPAQAASRVRCPVFLAHGTNDRTFSPAAARRIFDVIPTPKVYHPVEGHDHFTTAQSGEPLWRHLFAFFDEYLVSPNLDPAPISEMTSKSEALSTTLPLTLPTVWISLPAPAAD